MQEEGLSIRKIVWSCKEPMLRVFIHKKAMKIQLEETCGKDPYHPGGRR